MSGELPYLIRKLSPIIVKGKLRIFVGNNYIIILWYNVNEFMEITHDRYGVQVILMRCAQDLKTDVLGRIR